jgi:hypothetical protein
MGYVEEYYKNLAKRQQEHLIDVLKRLEDAESSVCPHDVCPIKSRRLNETKRVATPRISMF